MTLTRKGPWWETSDYNITYRALSAIITVLTVRTGSGLLFFMSRPKRLNNKFALLQEDMQAWLAPKYRPVSLSSPQKMALFTRHVFCYRMKSRKHLLLLLVLVTPLCPKMLNWFSWSTTQKLFQRLTYKSCKLLSLLAFCCQSFSFLKNPSLLLMKCK